MQGSGAERFHVAPGGGLESARLGNRLSKCASASLITVADGFFAATDHVFDRPGVKAVPVEQHAECVDAARLAGEVLEEDVRRQ